MSVPFILGPVSTGSSFMLASIQNSKPYILNGATGGNQILYYWESNTETIVNSSNIPIFTSEGQLDNIILNDTVNGGGIGFTGSTTIANVNDPTPFSMNQTSYANWYPPDVFLSMPIYSIYNSSGSTGSILTSNSPTGGIISANNIIILPVLLYSNCTSSGTYNVISQPLDSIINWFCNVDSGLAGCSGISIIMSGWTNLSDCLAGYNYSYCPTGYTCDYNDCKGPCPSMYDDCLYSLVQSGTGRFYCEFNPLRYITEDQWWTSPIFIGSITAFFVIIIVLIFIAIVISRHNKKVPKSSSNYDSI